MRMFLLRPILLALHRYNQDSDPCADIDASIKHMVELDSLIRVSKICITVTRALIDLIYIDVHNDQDPSIVWWYGVYCRYRLVLIACIKVPAHKDSDIYTCATVIHTARLCSALQDCNEIKTLQDSFNDCLECLSKYELYGLPAKRCRTALHMLGRRAFPISSRKLMQLQNIITLRSKLTM
jgi:hypothetical protein